MSDKTRPQATVVSVDAQDARKLEEAEVRLKSYYTKWYALWADPDQALEFAVSSSWLVNELLQEAERAVDRPKRARMILESKLKAFDDFKEAKAEERDAVCQRIYQARLDLDEDDSLGLESVGVADQAFPLVIALRKGAVDAIKVSADALSEISQKQVWFHLAQFPYAFKIYELPELIAVRILPDFVGGTENFRRDLADHIRFVCDSWTNIVQNERSVQAFESWLRRLALSPLTRIESGCWWTRILLERVRHDIPTKLLEVVFRHLKETCPREVVERELQAFKISFPLISEY